VWCMRRKTFSGGSRQWCHALLDEIAPSRASRASSSSWNFRTTWRPKRNRLVDDRSRKNKIGDVSRSSRAARMVGAETGEQLSRDENEQTFLALRTPNFTYENSSLLMYPPYTQPRAQSVKCGSEV
jgi:hypothetical protein